MKKVFQRQVLTCLSGRYGVVLAITGAVVLVVSALQFGEAWLEWSIEKYHANFNEFNDNVSGRSFKGRLCSPIPIDIVYTWVNGSDPRLLTQLSSLRRQLDLPDDVVSASRFQDNEELRFSLRSIERHAPWVRHIYIVTNGQIPHWLNLDHPRLSIITHEMLFDNKTHLPTFSSPAIEANIHKIPGLSEKFIYLNDDVMFGTDVWPDDFYTHGAGQKVYLAWGVPNCNEGCPSSWLGDRYCDAPCNTSSCDWDGGDCLNATIVANSRAGGAGGSGTTIGGRTGVIGSQYCSPGCPDTWIADRYCDKACQSEACGYDGGDCGPDALRTYVHGIVLDANTTEILLPPMLPAAYFNLTDIFGDAKITLGSHDNPTAVRTASISQRLKTLTITFHRHVRAANTTIELTAKLNETVLFHNFTVFSETFNATAAEIARDELREEELAAEAEEYIRNVTTVASSAPSNATAAPPPPHVPVSHVWPVDPIVQGPRDRTTMKIQEADTTNQWLNLNAQLAAQQRYQPPPPLDVPAARSADQVVGEMEAPFVAQNATLSVDVFYTLRNYSSEFVDGDLTLKGYTKRVNALAKVHGVAVLASVSSTEVATSVIVTATASPADSVRARDERNVDASDAPTASARVDSDEVTKAQSASPTAAPERPTASTPVEGVAVSESATYHPAPARNDTAVAQEERPVDVDKIIQRRNLLAWTAGDDDGSGSLRGNDGPIPTAEEYARDADGDGWKPLGVRAVEFFEQLATDAKNAGQSLSASVPEGKDSRFIHNAIGERRSPLPWERVGMFPKWASDRLREIERSDVDGASARESLRALGVSRGGRRLMDTFADSLKHVNKIYNKVYGTSPRKVPAHMPHMIDRTIIAQLQDKFPSEFQRTSANKLRSIDDMQYAFSYFYFLMSEKTTFNLSRVFETIDTDNDGKLSGNELRTLAATILDVPLKQMQVEWLWEAIANCTGTRPVADSPVQNGGRRLFGAPGGDLEAALSASRAEQLSSSASASADESAQNASSPHPGVAHPEVSGGGSVEHGIGVRWSGDFAVPITLDVIAGCKAIVDKLNVSKATAKESKFKFEIMDGQGKDIAFKMLQENVTRALHYLDAIRRDRNKFICLNDNINHTLPESYEVVAAIRHFYEALFPIQSSFELPPTQRNRFLHLDELQQWRGEQRVLQFYMNVAIVSVIFLVFCLCISGRVVRAKRAWAGRGRATPTPEGSRRDDTPPRDSPSTPSRKLLSV